MDPPIEKQRRRARHPNAEQRDDDNPTLCVRGDTTNDDDSLRRGSVVSKGQCAWPAPFGCVRAL
jgi:hypothetical protein